MFSITLALIVFLYMRLIIFHYVSIDCFHYMRLIIFHYVSINFLLLREHLSVFIMWALMVFRTWALIVFHYRSYDFFSIAWILIVFNSVFKSNTHTIELVCSKPLETIQLSLLYSSYYTSKFVLHVISPTNLKFTLIVFTYHQLFE